MKQIKEFNDKSEIFKDPFEKNKLNDHQREFIKNLLCVDQDKRWSAVTALASDWMKDSSKECVKRITRNETKEEQKLKDFAEKSLNSL